MFCGAQDIRQHAQGSWAHQGAPVPSNSFHSAMGAPGYLLISQKMCLNRNNSKYVIHFASSTPSPLGNVWDLGQKSPLAWDSLPRASLHNKKEEQVSSYEDKSGQKREESSVSLRAWDLWNDIICLKNDIAMRWKPRHLDGRALSKDQNKTVK